MEHTFSSEVGDTALQSSLPMSRGHTAGPGRDSLGVNLLSGPYTSSASAALIEVLILFGAAPEPGSCWRVWPPTAAECGPLQLVPS